jgi:hypothetical protein
LAAEAIAAQSLQGRALYYAGALALAVMKRSHRMAGQAER